jgi:hypothetical protein
MAAGARRTQARKYKSKKERICEENYLVPPHFSADVRNAVFNTDTVRRRWFEQRTPHDHCGIGRGCSVFWKLHGFFFSERR